MTVTFDIAAGPLGREGVHTWPAGTAAELALGDIAAGPPWYIIDNIDGLRGLGDADANVATTGDHAGEYPLPGHPRGKTITYTVRVVGRTLLELRQASARMVGLFSGRTLEQLMQITPGGDYAGVTWQYAARTIGLDDGDEAFSAGLLPGPWQQTFTVSLRLSDPRIYVSGDPQTVVVPAGGNVNAPNRGTAWVNALVSIGPGANPLLYNGTIDRTLKFVGLTVPAGQSITVDFANRMASMNGADVRGYIDPVASDWWHGDLDGVLAPGDNALGATGAQATFTYNEGVW